MPVPQPEPASSKGSAPASSARPIARGFRILTRPEEATEAPTLTPEAVRGWLTSLGVHGLLLLAMAFVVFAPRVNEVPRFDTRLSGSENGVEGGFETLGGLNTPIELMAAPDPSPEPYLKTLSPPELTSLLEKAADRSGAEKATGGGGLDNPNPGAGDGDGFGLARFGDGGESIRGISVKVGDPQFTLIWDTEVDLDLHVIEPGGKEIYWEEPKGKAGGELDVDNTKGFGPENIYWLREDESTGQKVKGPGPPGEYKWFVVYWGGFGGVPKPTRWKVRIKHEGKLTVMTGRLRILNEHSRTYTLKVEPGAASP